MKLNLRKGEKGITLIALVITIVILLILAGVALNIVLGDNGIFKKSKDSAQRYTESSLKEEISLLMGNWYMENTENGMALEDFLDAKRNDDTIEDYYKEDTDYVIVKDGYETIVDQYGNIIAGPDKIDIPGMYRIRFEAKGGTLTFTSKLIDQNNEIGEFPEIITKPTEQSVFDGWYLDKNYQAQAKTDVKPNANITIYAKWLGPWRITYNLNGGTQQETERYVTSGDAIGAIEALPIPTRTHYKFLGWYSKADFEETSKVDENTKPTDDMELYAKWEAQCKITFNSNGGTCDEIERYVDKNSSIGTLPTPTRTHYKFLGWYSKADFEATSEVNSNTVPTSDMELYAKWEAQCKIIFNANGGTCSETERYVDKNSSIGTLPIACKEEDPLGVWYTDTNFTTQVTKDTVIIADMEIYAKWQGRPIYKLDLTNLQNGVNGVTMSSSGVTVDSTKRYLTFNGSGTLKIAANVVDPSDSLAGTTNKSLCCWFKTAGGNGEQGICSYGRLSYNCTRNWSTYG